MSQENTSDDVEMGSGVSSNSWIQTFEQIRDKHDSAYKSIETAITLEEQEKPEEAIEKYKHGIQLIDEALRVPVTSPETRDSSWEKACVMIQKMKKSRAEVLMRIHSIQSSSPQSEEPPSYDEAMTPTSEEETTPRTYSDLARALNKLKIDQNHLPMEAQLVYLYEGVRLYFISPDGEVSSTSEPQTMKIFLVDQDEGNSAEPAAVLQIGGWVYPLIPGVSPCYRTEYGAFILPNVYVDQPGASIGIILPSDADAEVFELLESILYGIVGEFKREQPPKPDISQTISSGIINGAWYISQGLVRGAEKIGDLLDIGTPKLISKLKSTEQPAQVPEPVTKSVQIATCATDKAVQVTGYIADQVGIATMKLGHFLAPHIQKQGTRLLSSGFKMSETDASNKVKGVLTVAAGAVEGFSTVYHGLEESASILGRNLKDNTVKVVQHKYGQPAGEFTAGTLSTMGNVYCISKNTRVIMPKNIAKRTAKAAGQAVMHDYNRSPNEFNGVGASSSSSAGPSTSYSAVLQNKDVQKQDKL